MIGDLTWAAATILINDFAQGLAAICVALVGGVLVMKLIGGYRRWRENRQRVSRIIADAQQAKVMGCDRCAFGLPQLRCVCAGVCASEWCVGDHTATLPRIEVNKWW